MALYMSQDLLRSGTGNVYGLFTCGRPAPLDWTDKLGSWISIPDYGEFWNMCDGNLDYEIEVTQLSDFDPPIIVPFSGTVTGGLSDSLLGPPGAYFYGSTTTEESGGYKLTIDFWLGLTSLKRISKDPATNYTYLCPATLIVTGKHDPDGDETWPSFDTALLIPNISGTTGFTEIGAAKIDGTDRFEIHAENTLYLRLTSCEVDFV